ncbi:hypothetical protein [Allobaculum sp. Allo2]|uniref:hypothetical protein n=1 Tax=Allobaculum sp. Allo2 TaxID=2853432 RepID=UPI001F607AED|nr:hypothetical protein [Allobaculum sp. Allo2]UNT93846.1 hypothetical protein KWG61_03760 [Allobaculum sp. Allo2]
MTILIQIRCLVLKTVRFFGRSDTWYTLIKTGIDKYNRSCEQNKLESAQDAAVKMPVKGKGFLTERKNPYSETLRIL